MFQNDPNMRKFFQFHGGLPNMPHGTASSGSGVMVDPSGIILTNNQCRGRRWRHHRSSRGDGREFKAAEIKPTPRPMWQSFAFMQAVRCPWHGWAGAVKWK